MKPVLALLTLALSTTSALAAPGPQGSCNLVNAYGAAQLVLDGDGGGEVRGLNGVSPVRHVRESGSLGAVQMYEIEYTSQITAAFRGHDNVRVQLALVASPGTALMGVNYQGVLALPIGLPALAFPGPFSYTSGNWLNPFGPFIPTMVPAGFAPIAAAYCNLR